MELNAHPGDAAGPVRRIEVGARRGADGLLRLSWWCEADVEALALPAPAPPERADGLWRHSCFEAFVAATGAGSYCELNFSPSGRWAAYAFTGYRAGMTPLAHATPPATRWRRDADGIGLEAIVDPAVLLPGRGQGALRAGFAAVIETRSGTIGYWALRHPQGPPDFHHRDSFVLDVPAAGPQQGSRRA